MQTVNIFIFLYHIVLTYISIVKECNNFVMENKLNNNNNNNYR